MHRRGYFRRCVANHLYHDGESVRRSPLQDGFCGTHLPWTLDYFPNRAWVFNDANVLASRIWLNMQQYPWINGQIIYTSYPPLISVPSIQYYNTDGDLVTLDPSTYRVLPGSPGRICPTSGTNWAPTLSQPGAVQITMTCGYETIDLIPPQVTGACLMMVSNWYRNREAADETLLQKVPFGVDQLLDSLTYSAYMRM